MILLLLFVIISVSIADKVVSIPRLPIEAHGFNDLNVWPQLLVKGVRWFKIDVGACTQSSCASFSTWNKVPGRGDESDCWSEGGTSYCCLCLRGDTSSRPNLLDPFNTTYDLVAFLDDASNQGFLPTETDDELSIGLDFGAGPVFPGPSGCFFGCGAAPLIRKFILTFTTVAQKRGLAIRGSNDVGFGGWFQDLDSRCANGQCNADDLMLQAVPWVSQAGVGWVSGTGSNRFQVLNDDYDGFENACKNAAWSTVPANITPWLWYEQTGQQDYLKMLGWWNTCNTLPPAKRADLTTQLVMVSNLAPEQMEVFSAPSGLTLRGENSEIFGAQTGYVQPWIIAVPSAASTSGKVCGNCDRFIILAAQSTTATPDGTQIWILPMTGRITPALSEALISTILPTGADASKNPVVAFFLSHCVGEDAINSPDAVLITAITSNGNATSVIFDPSTASFTTPSSCKGAACLWSVSLLPGNALVSAAIVCNSSIPATLPSSLSELPCVVVYAQANANGSGDLTLSSSTLLSGSPSLSTTTVAHSVSIDKGAGLTLAWNGAGSSFSGILLYASKFNGTLDNIINMNKTDMISALSEGSKLRLKSLGVDVDTSFQSMEARRTVIDYMTQQEVSLCKSKSSSTSTSSSITDDGTRAYIYGSSLDISVTWSSSTTPTISAIIQPTPGTEGPPPRLAVGALPRLSSIRFNTSVLIMAMSTDGSCDAGIYVNNADMTRCGLPDPSFDDDPFYSTFQNVPFTVSYDYGMLSDWVNMVSYPGNGVNGRLGMCNKFIQHGKIETGLRPTAAMFPWTVQYLNSSDVNPHIEVGLLAVHDASVPSMPPQLLLCGEPTSKKGLIWDSWRIPQPWQLASL